VDDCGLSDGDSGIFAFFFVPETKGRTLEELDYMFEAKASARGFQSFDTSLLTPSAAEVEIQSSEPKQVFEHVERV